MTKIANSGSSIRPPMLNIGTKSNTTSSNPLQNILQGTVPTGLNALAPGDTVAKDEQTDAKKLIADGKPQGDGTTPEGDAALSEDFGNLRNIINAGGRPKLEQEVAKNDSGGWMEEKKNINNEAASKSKTTLFEGRKTIKDYGHTKKAYSKKTGWTDDKTEKKRDNVSAHATLINKGFTARTDFNVAKGEHTTAGGTKLSGRVDVLSTHARGAVTGGIDLTKGKIEGEAAIRVGADLVSIEGDISTQNKLGEFKAKGKARVGVDANGSVGVHIGKDTVKVDAGVEAFAGARATLDLKQNVNIGGHHIGSAGVRGEAYAGIGVKAKVEAGYEKGHIKASVDVGAALGVGVGVKFNVDVDVKGTYNAVKDGAVAVKNKAMHMASSAKKSMSAAWNRYKPW